ncbi:MAG TPA: hypothetical protein VGF99_01600, partial [Myxococcota bacterium]
MLSRIALVAVVGLAALPAAAQQILDVRETLRGPFQHAVVGSSLVTREGTLLPDSSARLALPGTVVLERARLYWMGSRVTADPTVRLTLPNATGLDVTATAGECDVAVNVNRNNGATDDNYYACSHDVTTALRGTPLSGVYTVGGADFETRTPRYCTPANCEYNAADPLARGFDSLGNPIVNPFVDNVYAGGWTLLLVYRDIEDNRARVLQFADGMVAQQNSDGIRQLAGLDTFKLSAAGGLLTHVAIGGDDFQFSGANDGERIDLCRGPCSTPATIAPNNTDPAVIHSLPSPTGGLYNESISTESSTTTLTDVEETSGIDIDTYSLAPAFDADTPANNAFVARQLTVGASTGIDALGHVLIVVEVIDLDSDGDGLTDLQEDADHDDVRDNNETNPLLPDTDGDGLCDGPNSVFDGVGADSELVCLGGEDRDSDADPSDRGVSETNPLNPDSDGDGLCDGFKSVLGVCVAGENIDGGDVAQNETDPLNPDSDDDGLCDGRPSVPLTACSGFENEDGGDVDPDTETDPLLPDTDSDGLCDGNVDVVNPLVGNCTAGEDDNANGVVDDGETDPRLFDTDGDGLNDGLEVLGGGYGGPVDANPAVPGFQTDPLDVDSDGDGFCDGDNADDIDTTYGTCTGGEDRNLDGDVDAGEGDPTNDN